MTVSEWLERVFVRSPRQAAQDQAGGLGPLLTAIATDPSDATGAYYDERGKPMRASTQVGDPEFADRYIAQTRALLAA